MILGQILLILGVFLTIFIMIAYPLIRYEVTDYKDKPILITLLFTIMLIIIGIILT